MVEYLLADIRHNPLTNPGHQIEAGEGAKGQAQHQHEKQPQSLGQHLWRLGCQALIHQNTQTLPQRQGHAGGKHQRHQGTGNGPVIGADKLASQSQGSLVFAGDGAAPCG